MTYSSRNRQGLQPQCFSFLLTQIYRVLKGGQQGRERDFISCSTLCFPCSSGSWFFQTKHCFILIQIWDGLNDYSTGCQLPLACNRAPGFQAERDSVMRYGAFWFLSHLLDSSTNWQQPKVSIAPWLLRGLHRNKSMVSHFPAGISRRSPLKNALTVGTNWSHLLAVWTDSLRIDWTVEAELPLHPWMWSFQVKVDTHWQGTEESCAAAAYTADKQGTWVSRTANQTPLTNTKFNWNIKMRGSSSGGCWQVGYTRNGLIFCKVLRRLVISNPSLFIKLAV